MAQCLQFEQSFFNSVLIEIVIFDAYTCLSSYDITVT